MRPRLPAPGSFDRRRMPDTTDRRDKYCHLGSSLGYGGIECTEKAKDLGGVSAPPASPRTQESLARTAGHSAGEVPADDHHRQEVRGPLVSWSSRLLPSAQWVGRLSADDFRWWEDDEDEPGQSEDPSAIAPATPFGSNPSPPPTVQIAMP